MGHTHPNIKDPETWTFQVFTFSAQSVNVGRIYSEMYVVLKFPNFQILFPSTPILSPMASISDFAFRLDVYLDIQSLQISLSSRQRIRYLLMIPLSLRQRIRYLLMIPFSLRQRVRYLLKIPLSLRQRLRCLLKISLSSLTDKSHENRSTYRIREKGRDTDLKWKERRRSDPSGNMHCTSTNNDTNTSSLTHQSTHKHTHTHAQHTCGPSPPRHSRPPIFAHSKRM